MMWCGLDSGRGRIITSHPALEGTSCDTSKWCELGSCVSWAGDRLPLIVPSSTFATSLTKKVIFFTITLI